MRAGERWGGAPFSFLRPFTTADGKMDAASPNGPQAGRQGAQMLRYKGSTAYVGGFVLAHDGLYFVKIVGTSRNGRIAAQISRGLKSITTVYDSVEQFTRLWGER